MLQYCVITQAWARGGLSPQNSAQPPFPNGPTNFTCLVVGGLCFNKINYKWPPLKFQLVLWHQCFKLCFLWQVSNYQLTTAVLQSTVSYCSRNKSAAWLSPVCCPSQTSAGHESLYILHALQGSMSPWLWLNAMQRHIHFASPETIRDRRRNVEKLSWRHLKIIVIDVSVNR